MSKSIEHFFEPVGGNDSSSSKAVHAAAILAAQKETEQAFAKIKTQKFCSAGNSRKFHIANISTHTVSTPNNMLVVSTEIICWMTGETLVPWLGINFIDLDQSA